MHLVAGQHQAEQRRGFDHADPDRVLDSEGMENLSISSARYLIAGLLKAVEWRRFMNSARNCTTWRSTHAFEQKPLNPRRYRTRPNLPSQ